MPRVLRILNRLIIGGPALNATLLTRYMPSEFETMLVIGGKDDHEQDAVHLTEGMGIEAVVVSEMKRDINPLNDGKAYQKVKDLIDKFRPDVVHTHAAKSGVIGRLAAEASGVPVIVHTFHGHVFHSYFSKFKSNTFVQIERYLARRSSGIIAISESQKDELSNTYKICSEDKMQIIPLGMDLDKFMADQEAKRKKFRDTYLIADDEVAIGIIGRIVPIKNHSLFVEACARVLKTTTKKIRLIIVGDGDMRPQTETELKQAGIDYAFFPEDPRPATAVLTSWLTKMDEVMAGVDIVALTSNNEGTPVSLIEAQAASKPVVSTNVGGVSDIITSDCGFITEPKDAVQFADALAKLVESEELRRSMGCAGRQAVLNKFSYQRLVSDMSRYYYDLLDNRKINPALNRII